MAVSMKLFQGPETAYLAVATDFCGLAMILPLLPFFIKERGEDDAWLGAVLTAQYGGVVIGSVLFGWVSDKLGRRAGVLLSLLGDALLFASSGLADSVEVLFAVRLLAGCECCGCAAAMALRSDAAPTQSDASVLAPQCRPRSRPGLRSS